LTGFSHVRRVMLNSLSYSINTALMRALCLLLFLFLLPYPFLFSQEADLYSENRVALVIGNGDYLSGPLINPVNDARSMARALREAKFNVLLRENLSNQAEMKQVIREFGDMLKAGGTGLFYYAGHGLQVKGYNYLVPVNAVIRNEEEVEYEGVEVGFVLAQMEAARNRVNIVILDACRNNPYARSFRDIKQGLVGMNAPTGTLIAYSTAPGSTAADGTGVNGLYTQELLYQIKRPGLKIEEVFKNVRAEVVRKSDGMQTPWESSSLIGDFYFVPTEQSYVAVVQPSETESVRSVQWQADSRGYTILVNGEDVTEETESIESGQDLVVIQKGTNMRYLLRNYWNNRDQKLRSAEILPSATSDYYDKNESTAEHVPITTATWKASPEGYYWLYVNGVDISKETTYTTEAGNLKVYHTPSKTTFLLVDFFNRLDNNVREATIVKPGMQKKLSAYVTEGKINARWHANNEGYFWLEVNGVDITDEVTHRLEGNNLYVHHAITNRTYLLKNFVNRLDNIWRKAVLVSDRITNETD